MKGVILIDRAIVEATTGHMLVTFESGGDTFRFHLPGHIALAFRETVMRDAWQVCCTPDAEVVAINPKQEPKG